MSYPPKNLVHVDGRWYRKGTEPKSKNTKVPKQSTNEESKNKTVLKPAKSAEPINSVESDK